MQGDVPYWGAGGVLDYVDTSLFDEPLVLLGEDGAPFFDPGKDVAHYIEGPAWVNNHIHVLRPTACDGRFLTYALNAVDYANYITGSTRDKLTQDDLKEIVVPRPPLEEQRRIADFLDAETTRVERLLRLREQHIALIEERWESLIHTALTEFRVKTVELRRLGVRVTTGPFGTVFSANEYATHGIPMVNPIHISDGEIRPDFNHTVAPETAARLSRHRLRAGDLVVGRKGDIGRAALVRQGQDGWLCGSDCIALHPSSDRTRSMYLAYVLRSQYVRSQLQARSLATTMPSLNEGNLLALRVPDLSIDEQDKAILRLDRASQWTMDTVDAMRRQLSIMGERRNALITAAVAGQFDVSTASGRGVTE